MQELTRRGFLWALSASGAMPAANPQSANPSPTPSAMTIKPISGSWFEFQHPSTVEGVDWNATCACFTGQQWDAKIKEIAQVGMEYLALMGTALDNRSFVPTTIFPQWHLACPDPLEAVLSAADKYGVKFFIGAGFYGNWGGPNAISDPVAAKKRVRAIEEITRLYIPLEKVREVLQQTKRASRRERDLPAQVVVYYAIALALYMRSSYREVLRCLLEGVPWLRDPSATVKVAGKSGISQARSRLGPNR